MVTEVPTMTVVDTVSVGATVSVAVAGVVSQTTEMVDVAVVGVLPITTILATDVVVAAMVFKAVVTQGTCRKQLKMLEIYGTCLHHRRLEACIGDTLK